MNNAPNVGSAGAREMKTVVVLALGFGLVGIDRFLISTLFPTIANDLKLSYGDIGTVAGALAIAWGIAALFMGNLSDHIGRRRVLTVALLAFSLMIGASGLATGLMGLVLVRVVMGFADGAYTPASISATIEASPPERHGRNIGLQQMMLPLLGLGIAPLLVTALLHVIDWRWIFLIFVVPGLLLTWFTWRIVRAAPAAEIISERNSFQDWRTVFSYWNVRVLMICMLCWLICVVVSSALLPNYFLDYLKLSSGQMGTVMSAIGFGSAAGTILLPWLSDRTGRKPVMLLGTIGACGSLVWLSSLNGDSVAALFWSLFAVHFFNNALITLTVGPICTETVPPRLMATASGLIIAVGELLGGGLGPIVAGQVAERLGIEHILWLPIGGMALGLLLCLLLKETNPAITGDTTHHSFAMFDQSQHKSIEGTVRALEFTFPRAWLWIDVPDGKGGTLAWGFEDAGPAELNRFGDCTNTSVRRGDKITINYRPLTSGQAGGAFISMKLADGRVLKGFELACVPKQPQ